ncbi:hypothetical protein EOE67_09740 [Rheinheimera riviphila]|uniref:Polysaccharide biosynthesis protein n=1 Tax=Rheinheimera riviphila TaxID=1834037 RepID=A0A437QSJ5_9GAMM|nr:hypothetical protein [Rheinheimera riviphila]RVU37464.1 hypothetical protein EOE67_09740 [Rheinheimera riviphila]
MTLLFARIFSPKYLTLVGNITLAMSSFVLGYLLLLVAPAKDYGNFAFMLIVQGLGFGVINALLASPLLIQLHHKQLSTRQLAGFTRLAFALAFLTGLLQGALLAVQHYDLAIVLLYSAAGLVQLLRWYGRCYCQNLTPALVVVSDLLFGVLCTGAALLCWWWRQLDFLNTGWILLCSGLVACAPFVASLGRSLLQTADFSALQQGYSAQGKPALIGVVTVEMTANIHSYLVVLIAGAAAFAPLAAAALFLRPMSVIQASLGQSEKPQLTKALAENALNDHENMGGGLAKIMQLMGDFRRLSFAAFMLNSVLVLMACVCWPVLLWPDDLSRTDFVAALGLLLLIALLRSVRGPTSALLQAADQFRPLAKVTLCSSAITVPLVVVLLWCSGPISTLVGILVGELIMTIQIEKIYRKLLQQLPCKVT